MSGAIGKVHVGEPSRAQWLAAQCAARPGLVSRVEAVIRDPYGRRDVSPLCTWQDWHRGMQLLERAVRRGTDTFIPNDFRDASSLLREDGHRFAGPLWTMGSYADRVAPYRQSWTQRYASRARTADELAAAQLISEGRVREYDPASWVGIDGARYAVVVQGKPGGWRPAVLVENSADAVELVPFAGERSARAWIHNRVRGTGGPLRGGTTGPSCRAALEEDVLAWLVHAAHDAQPWDLLGQVAWTSHLRAEVFRAAEQSGRDSAPADPRDLIRWRVRTSYTHWMPFVPGWAADEIGWPDGRHARSYFERLAVTPVSEAQALRAAQALVRADAEAAARVAVAAPEAAAVAGVAEVPVRPLVPSGRRRAVEPAAQRGRPPVRRRGVQLPPQRSARRAGPEPR
jgi:hypothetical protein